MKAILQLTTRVFALLAIVASASATEPNETGSAKVCGTLKSFEGEIQVFDYTRTHLADATFGARLNCGDWVSVEKGKATIEHTSGAAALVAENTFLQVVDPQSGNNPEHAHFALYRGEFLVHAGKKSGAEETRVITPNAVARISSGGAFLVYSEASEESQIVGLGAKATLENRFFSQSKMPTDFAKVVTFGNPVERLLPEQARFVNSRDLGARLTRLGVETAVLEALEKAVKIGTKTKMPVTLALTSRAESEIGMTGEIKSHAPSERLSKVGTPTQSRAPASVKGPRVSKKALSSEPNFALKRKGHDEGEKVRLLQALSTMRADE